MKFFIDTADPNEIRQAADMGLLDGVTTNPTLIKRSGLARDEAIAIICVAQGPGNKRLKSTTLMPDNTNSGGILFSELILLYSPLNSAWRFSRNAPMPSLRSAL